MELQSGITGVKYNSQISFAIVVRCLALYETTILVQKYVLQHLNARCQRMRTSMWVGEVEVYLSVQGIHVKFHIPNTYSLIYKRRARL